MLPLAALKLVLQQLTSKQRMQDAALVNTSWAAAAVAATVDKNSEHIHLDSFMRARACHLWCVKHAAYVKKLRYSNMRAMSSPVDP